MMTAEQGPAAAAGIFFSTPLPDPFPKFDFVCFDSVYKRITTPQQAEILLQWHILALVI